MSTSKRPARSSKKPDAIDRPFDPAVLKRARKLAAGYRIVLEQSDDLGFVGSAIEMPTVFADGKTPDACVKATRQGLTAAVATMLEMGKRPPGGKGKRTLQVNIRLAPEEKYELEQAAVRLGFRAVSDFMRAVTLERCTKA